MISADRQRDMHKDIAFSPPETLEEALWCMDNGYQSPAIERILREHLDEARAVLKQVGLETTETTTVCNECEWLVEDRNNPDLNEPGHAPDCRLARVLG